MLYQLSYARVTAILPLRYTKSARALPGLPHPRSRPLPPSTGPPQTHVPEGVISRGGIEHRLHILVVEEA
jgi:hypothetical protein